MNTFIACATYFVLVVGVSLIGALIYKNGPYLSSVRRYKLKIAWLQVQREYYKMRPEFLKKSWWIGEFPDFYHPKCFECNLDKTACPDCQYRAWGETPNATCVDGFWFPCC
jgi:hypothetical protein